MKLTSAQVERTINQFEAQALPDSHPAARYRFAATVQPSEEKAEA